MSEEVQESGIKWENLKEVTGDRDKWRVKCNEVKYEKTHTRQKR